MVCMMRRLPVVILLLLSATALTAQDKKICLTFDTLPAMKPLGFWTPREISNMILRTLAKHQIKAAGFVVEEKLDEDPPVFIVLEDWVTRGHILGNQTYSNVDLNELSADDFLRHVKDGQKYLWAVSKRHKFNFRYLRYPQLHEGETSGKRKDVRRALEEGGYAVAPVTVKTSDYRFNRAYIEAKGDQQVIDRLRQGYLEHVEQQLNYAESQSQKVFGKNITQIMWLHSGIATATFLEELIDLLQKRGYQFISFPDALADPAFATPETYVGPLGLSFIDRVAATKGLPYDADHGRIKDEGTLQLVGPE